MIDLLGVHTATLVGMIKVVYIYLNLRYGHFTDVPVAVIMETCYGGGTQLLHYA
jgi:hypothetical protein